MLTRCASLRKLEGGRQKIKHHFHWLPLQDRLSFFEMIVQGKPDITEPFPMLDEALVPFSDILDCILSPLQDTQQVPDREAPCATYMHNGARRPARVTLTAQCVGQRFGVIGTHVGIPAAQ